MAKIYKFPDRGYYHRLSLRLAMQRFVKMNDSGENIIRGKAILERAMTRTNKVVYMNDYKLKTTLDRLGCK